MTRLVKEAAARGLLLMTHFNVAMICPPLTITREELEEGLAIIDELLYLADEEAGG